MRKPEFHINWFPRGAALLILCSLYFSIESLAQDVRLGQFYQSYVTQNPAATAAGDQDIRAALHYRKQWGSISKGYGTNGASAEVAFLKEKGNTNYLGVGLYVLNDKAGKSQLQSLDIKGSVAYHLATDRYNRLSFGLALGYQQRSISFSDLAWDSQFNGINYDPTLPANETFASQSKGFVDASFGGWWWHSAEVDWKLGYAVQHFLQNRSFLDGPKDRLFLKQNILFALTQKVSYFKINYDLLVNRQAGAMEITGGFRAEYRIGMDSRYTNVNTSSAVYAGCHYRLGDGLIPVVGFEFERMIAAFVSYDLTMSRFSDAVGIAGGPEISLVYTASNSGQRRKLK